MIGLGHINEQRVRFHRAGQGRPFYDKLAPTKLAAAHTPRLVTILCTLPVAASTHAASLFSRVVNPGWTVSKIFFFGFKRSSAALSSKPSKKTRSPGCEPAGGLTNSTPPSLPSLEVAWFKRGREIGSSEQSCQSSQQTSQHYRESAHTKNHRERLDTSHWTHATGCEHSGTRLPES